MSDIKEEQKRLYKRAEENDIKERKYAGVNVVVNKELYDEYKGILQEQIDELQNRISKAIEYINENKHLSMFADCREPKKDWNYDLECSANDLINILQGSDKE